MTLGTNIAVVFA